MRTNKADAARNLIVFLAKCEIAERIATAEGRRKPLEGALQFAAYTPFRGRTRSQAALSLDTCNAASTAGLVEYRNGWRLTAAGRAALEAHLAQDAAARAPW